MTDPDYDYAGASSCPSCHVPYIDHLGLNGTCAMLLAMTAERDKAMADLAAMAMRVERAETEAAAMTEPGAKPVTVAELAKFLMEPSGATSVNEWVVLPSTEFDAVATALDNPPPPSDGLMALRDHIQAGVSDSNAGRVTEMDFSQYIDEPCPHCGKPCDTWFDRSLDADGNMTTRCRGCGNDIDKPPTTAERDKALAELREAKADAEAAKAERNGMHVRNYREMQAAIAQRDELAALLLDWVASAEEGHYAVLRAYTRATVSKLTPTAPTTGAETKE